MVYDPGMEKDTIDVLVGQWRRLRPELDPSAMSVEGRILRLAGLLERRLGTLLAPWGVDPGQFDVLATLRRCGGRRGLCPTDLVGAAMLSSGAMTNRLDRLETAGLVRRTPDPEDRRGIRVCLTPKGRRLVDAVIASRFAAADETIACLTPKEARATAAALRKLLFAAESAAGAAAR